MGSGMSENGVLSLHGETAPDCNRPRQVHGEASGTGVVHPLPPSFPPLPRENSITYRGANKVSQSKLSRDHQYVSSVNGLGAEV